MYLLDTNVVSEPRRARPFQPVIDWLERQDAAEFFISSVSLGELWRGALKVPGRKSDALRQWLEIEVQLAFRGRILPWTDQTARRWAEMTTTAERNGRPRPYLDSLIAATALEHGLTLVSRNTADFEGLGVPLFNPWQD